MGDRTAIEWTDASWNPIRAADLATGALGHWCAHVSEGCRNCYAERLQKRFGQTVPFTAQLRDRVEIRLDERALMQPLRWRRPRRIFVCSMTDLFGEWVDDAMLDRIFAVMALAPQHSFQILTKRPERMRGYLGDDAAPHRIARDCLDLLIARKVKADESWPVASIGDIDMPDDVRMSHWPLPNVWLGVSVEDQAAADARVPVLLDTPAAVRFVSAEPLLGAVDLSTIISRDGYYGPMVPFNALRDCKWTDNEPVPRIDWVIAGGESGPGARPMHPDWARSLRYQCAAADVPFFFKQWGEWAPSPEGGTYDEHRARGARDLHAWADGGAVELVGKARAGRMLDGRTHDGFPAVAGP